MNSEEFVKSFGKDYSTNGKCENCNECCTVDLPLTRREYKYFKKLINENIHDLREFYRIIKEREKYYLMCPFSNIETKKCMIYNDRPSICKVYHCHNKGNEILKNYDIATSSKRKHNLKDCLPKDIVRYIEEGYRLLKKPEEKMYKVIDEFTLEFKLFEDKKEAIKECINIQGIVVDTTTDEVIYDATGF